MTFVVKATFGGPGNRRRVTSREFRTRKEAQVFADNTNRDRRGSNARVMSV